MSTYRALTFAVDHYLIMRPAGLSDMDVLNRLSTGNYGLIRTLYSYVSPKLLHDRILDLTEQFKLYAAMENSDQVIRLKDRLTRIESAFEQCIPIDIANGQLKIFWADDFQELENAVKGE